MPSPVEKELLTYFSPEKPLIIFDIGSCDGQDAIRYQQLYTNSRVLSFEPIPENIARIRENIRLANAKNIAVYEMAMSNQAGTANLQVSSGSPNTRTENYIPQSSSLLAPDKHLALFPWCKFDELLEVKTDRLDNFCKAHGISEIDFIHLDVQGAELMVLEGAGEFLNNVRCIWLEVENVSLYKNQPLRADVERFMLARHFVLIKFRVGGFSGDQFYVRRDFLQKEKGNAAVRFLELRSSVLRSGPVIAASRLVRKLRFLLTK